MYNAILRTVWYNTNMDKQQGRKLRRKNRWADVLAAIILLGVLALSGFTLRDYMHSKILDFANAQEGSIAVTLPGELLVFRHEYVLTAPVAGEFKPAATEGERVKEGGIVGYCGNVAVAATKGGAVSYELDGWEEKLLIDSIHDLDWPQIFQLNQEEYAAAALADNDAGAVAADNLAGLNLSANRPVARLVDNLLDYQVMLQLRDPRDLLAEAETIHFSLPEGKRFSCAVKERWQIQDGRIYYIFNIPSKEDILFNLRYSEIEVIAKDVQGIIIPSSAVFLGEEGRVGVYMQRKRKLVFTEIVELTSKDGFSVVSGLDRMAVVVTNPAKATEGQRIY